MICLKCGRDISRREGTCDCGFNIRTETSVLSLWELNTRYYNAPALVEKESPGHESTQPAHLNITVAELKRRADMIGIKIEITDTSPKALEGILGVIEEREDSIRKYKEASL